MMCPHPLPMKFLPKPNEPELLDKLVQIKRRFRAIRKTGENKKKCKIIPIRLRIWDFFCTFASEMKNGHDQTEDIHK